MLREQTSELRHACSADEMNEFASATWSCINLALRWLHKSHEAEHVSLESCCRNKVASKSTRET